MWSKRHDYCQYESTVKKTRAYLVNWLRFYEIFNIFIFYSINLAVFNANLITNRASNSRGLEIKCLHICEYHYISNQEN